MSCCEDPTMGVEVVVTSKSPNVAFAITTSGTGNTRTVAIQTDVAGTWLFRVWLEDAATPTGELSTTLPDTPHDNEWWKITAATGALSFDITYSGAHTWYVNAVLIGPVGTSDALIYT